MDGWGADGGLQSVVSSQQSALVRGRDPTFLAGEKIRQHQSVYAKAPAKSGMCSNCVYILGGALVLYLILSRR